jgi:hypothetical protein
VSSINKNSIEIIEVINLLSPVVLLKEVDNLIKNQGEKYFFLSDYYLHKDHKHIFWNMVYYFKLLQLPLFVMTGIRNEAKLSLILDELTFIRETSKSKGLSKFASVRFSATSESQKSSNTNNQSQPQINNNNNNIETGSKKSYVVIDNSSSVKSTPTHKVIPFQNKDWEYIYFKM